MEYEQPEKEHRCKYTEVCIRYAINKDTCHTSDIQYCHLRKNFERILTNKLEQKLDGQ